MPNWSQVSGVVERIILAAVMFAVGKGWIANADAADVVALAVAVIGALYAFYDNRSVSLAKQAAAIPSNPPTQVITSPEIAAATPAQANIRSSADFKAVQK